ncbi:MAG: hypothetical protein I8H76_03060 [Burkholderiales bacterium]|nr:hypothetical protein [Burkholderiales bacterium]MBH2017328.1 hypothetical protein [Burkholderiales bacterium]
MPSMHPIGRPALATARTPDERRGRTVTPVRGLCLGTCLGVVLITALLGAPGEAGAARPLTTDDAGVNEPGTCQVEAWRDQDRGAHHHHVAPACGVVTGVELGVEGVWSAPRDEQAQGRGLALKWVPAWARLDAIQFGLKLGVSSQKEPGARQWGAGQSTALVLASMPLHEHWDLHLNAGHLHRTDQQGVDTAYAAALVWRPHPRWQLGAEVLGNLQTSAQKSLSLRHWLIPETLGLDLTASRMGSRAETGSWGIGIGWYGIRF